MNFLDFGVKQSQVRNLDFTGFKKLICKLVVMYPNLVYAHSLLPLEFQISQQSYQNSTSVIIALICDVANSTFFFKHVLVVTNFLFTILAS